MNHGGLSQLLAQQANWALYLFLGVLNVRSCLSVVWVCFGLVFYCAFLSFKKLKGAAEILNGPGCALLYTA